MLNWKAWVCCFLAVALLVINLTAWIWPTTVYADGRTRSTFILIHVLVSMGLGAFTKDTATLRERIELGLKIGTLASGSVFAFALYERPVTAQLWSMVAVTIGVMLVLLFSKDDDPPSPTLPRP